MFGSRSHTDTLTNIVVLSEFDLGQHLQEIFERDLPIASLPTFLHEATHHWCFDTPVGLAMHLLFLRARRAAVAAHTGGSDEGWRALDSVLRYELFRDLTHPLSEGIALFTEHDAIPGAARTISTPMRLASSLYGRGYAFSGDEPYKELPAVLAAGRVSRRHTRRKAALLLEPMTCVTGGYLPGYLLVKTLWRFARAESDLFRDADFFLQYVRTHFFEDWGLVARLLDKTHADIGAVDPIAQHVSGRINQFVETAIRGDAPKLFETLSEAGEGPSVEIRTDVVEFNVKYLDLEPGVDVTLGRSRFKEAFEEHFASWTGDAVQDGLLEHDAAELMQRTLITLGYVTVQGRAVKDGFELSYEANPVVIVREDRFAEDITKLAGEVDLELVALSEPGGLCFTLSRGNKLLCTVPIGRHDLEGDLREVHRSRQTRTAFAALSISAIDQTLTDQAQRVALESMRENLRQLLDEWLIPIALMHVETERLPAIRAQMETNGFLDILNGDKNLLLDAATASLCIPSPYDFGSVADFHQWADGTPHDSILRILRLVDNALGYAPFMVTRGGLFEKASFI